MATKQGKLAAELRSPIYRSLIQLVTLLGQEWDADVAAGRVYRVARGRPRTHVATPQLGLTTTQARALDRWPKQRSSLFSVLAYYALPREAFRYEQVLESATSPGARAGQADRDAPPTALFAPVSQVASVRDALCLPLLLPERGWALLALVRSEPNPPFEADEVNALSTIRGEAETCLIEGCHGEKAGSSGRPRTASDARADPSRSHTAASDRLARLSETEQRVLTELRQRLTEPQVADRLNRSRHTIHVHVKNIYRKLGVYSRAELLRGLDAGRF